MAVGIPNFPTSLDAASDLVEATNNASTTVNMGIQGLTNTDATITVWSTSSFPATGIIRINNELISYSAKTATTFTVQTRGFESTIAANHANGSTVTLDITAASNNAKNSAIIALETKVGTGSSTPTSNTVLRGTGTGTSAFGQVGLTTDVTGTLPVANGGTGTTSLTANNVLLGNGTSAVQVVAPGTNGNVLTSNGTTWTSAAPTGGGGSNATAEGRLTLASGTPFTTTDQTAKTTLYYTPYNGNRIALFNGTSTWTQVTFTERSITIPSTTNTNYDVFIWNNSGTATLELTAWTNNTTRATALTLQDGIYVRSGDTTRRYIGTIRTTGTSGQCEDSMKSRLVWNMYNQELRGMECRPVPLSPPTDTHYIYTTAVWRAAGNNTTLGQARVDFVIGLPVYVVFSSLQNVYNASNAYMASSIGLDRTNGNDAYIFGGATVAGVQPMINAEFRRYVDLGYHYLQRVEISAELGSTLWYIYANATGVEAVRSGSSGFLAG